MPFLYHISDTTGWFSHADLANMIAVSESTPGPMGINMATYVGFTVAGIPGAVIATLGLVSPSIIVILIVAKFLETFRTNRTVDAVFYGLRPASCGLIAAAGLSVVSLALLNLNGPPAELFQWKYIALAAVILVLTRWVKPTKKLHPIVFILGSAARRGFIRRCRMVTMCQKRRPFKRAALFLYSNVTFLPKCKIEK